MSLFNRKQTGTRVAVETPEGRTIWLPEDKVAEWKSSANSSEEEMNRKARQQAEEMLSMLKAGRK